MRLFRSKRWLVKTVWNDTAEVGSRGEYGIVLTRFHWTHNMRLLLGWRSFPDTRWGGWRGFLRRFYAIRPYPLAESRELWRLS